MRTTLLLLALGAVLSPPPGGPLRSVPVDPAANALAGLRAMPKTHHSWPLSVNWTDPRMQPILTDYARITHAVSFSMEWDISPAAIAAATAICAETRAIIEFNYSPWGTDASPFPRHVLPTTTITGILH